jgi:hypothetical protein
MLAVEGKKLLVGAVDGGGDDIKILGRWKGTINIESSKTLQELKALVSTESKLEPDSITFLFKGKKLTDDFASVGDLGLKKNSKLMLIQNPTVQIGVSMISGKKVSVDVYPSDTSVAQLKQRLETMLQIPFHAQCLYFPGDEEPLENAAKLFDCQVVAGTTLFLIEEEEAPVEKEQALPLQSRRARQILGQASTENSVNLDHMSITDEEVKVVCSVLRRMKSLRRVDLSGNLITSAGTQRIADLIRESSKLVQVHLGGNAIDDVGAYALEDALRHAPTVESVDLRDTAVSAEAAGDIMEMEPRIRMATTGPDGEPEARQVTQEALRRFFLDVAPEKAQDEVQNWRATQSRYRDASRILDRLQARHGSQPDFTSEPWCEAQMRFAWTRHAEGLREREADAQREARLEAKHRRNADADVDTDDADEDEEEDEDEGEEEGEEEATAWIRANLNLLTGGGDPAVADGPVSDSASPTESAFDRARAIRHDGEAWHSAVQRARELLISERRQPQPQAQAAPAPAMHHAMHQPLPPLQQPHTAAQPPSVSAPPAAELLAKKSSFELADY